MRSHWWPWRRCHIFEHCSHIAKVGMIKPECPVCPACPRHRVEGVPATFKSLSHLSSLSLAVYEPPLSVLLRDPWHDRINQEIRTGFAKVRQGLAEPRKPGEAGPGP